VRFSIAPSITDCNNTVSQRLIESPAFCLLLRALCGFGVNHPGWPSLLRRGSVRIVAGLGTRTRRGEGYELAPANGSPCRTLRAGLEQRRSARSLRYRFRRDPAAYLAQLEALLLKHALPP
jgi:hypothetical protein